MTENTIQDVQRIALAASMPIEVRWLDAEAVGAMLGYSVSTVLQRIACKPGFPEARQIAGHPRWNAKAVADWASAQPVRNLRRRRVVVDPQAA